MNLRKAYTFDDVLLVPQKSDVLPAEVDLSTKITGSNIFTDSCNQFRYGYRNGIRYGNCYGKRRGIGNYS